MELYIATEYDNTQWNGLWYGDESGLCNKSDVVQRIPALLLQKSEK